MKLVNKVLCALFLAAGLATSVNAQTKPVVATSDTDSFNAWNLTLAGGGSTAVANTKSVFGFELGLSKEGQLVLPIEVGARQTLAYSSTANDIAFQTQPFADWRVLKLGNISLYAGANAQATYGNTPLTWTAGPEAVIKVDLTKDAYFYGRAGYDVSLANRNGFEDRSNDNFTYRVGIGVRF